MTEDERSIKTMSRMAPGDLRPCCPRHGLLSVGREDRDGVVGRVESDAGRADVVDHDRVEALALELAAAVLDRTVAVLGGEADQRSAQGAAAARAR